MAAVEQKNGFERHPPWHMSGRELGLIFAFWTFFALISVGGRFLDPRSPWFDGARGMALIWPPLVEAWLWAAATPAIFWLVSRHGPERWGRLVTILGLIVIGIFLAGVIDAIVDFVRVQVIGFNPRRAGRFAAFRGMRRLWFLNDLFVYSAIVAAGFARDYYLRFQERQAEAIRLRAQLAESRLEALRMQLNPHFLFNTLNAVSAMVERDPKGVRKMIARLSELLRHTLESTERHECPLRTELELLGRYFDIMQVRFQGKLKVETSIAPETREALVPMLILQPLVENAIEHGVSRLAGEGQITIRSRREGGLLVVDVEDNGPGPDSTGGGGRIGLENTRQRLVQRYGASAGVKLESLPGEGARATITLPYHLVGESPA